MKKPDIEIYEGDKPYIFVSYSRRDKDIVYPLIEFLSKEGYRVWYDSGIHPGTEWLDVIAERLDNCSLFLAFLSNNSIESRYCRKEFNFAVANNKDFVGVMLEDVELPPSMKMQMTTVQAIEYFKYNSEDAFKYSLEDSEFLAKCYEGKQEESTDEIKEETEVDNVDTTAEETTVDDNKEIKKEKEPRKKGSKKIKTLLIILAIIAIVAVGIGVWTFIKNNNPAAKYNPETMYHVTLEPDDEMSVKEFNEAVEILEGRLEVLVGKKAYMLDVQEEKIELYIDKAPLMEEDLEYVLHCYLTRSIDLYLFESGSNSLVLGESVPIDREDIEKIDIKEGTVEGVDTKEYGIETDTYKYVELTLTKAFAESIVDEAEEWGENMILAQDLDAQPSYGNPINLMEDGRTLKVFIEDLEGNFLDTFVYNVENAPLAHSFLYEMDINNYIDWEEVEETSKGKNQCNLSDLEGHTVTIIYRTYSSDLTEGEKLDINKVFKQRLDVLNQPYALGGYVKEDNTYVVIRTGFEHMGVPVMNLIGSQNTINLQGSLKQKTIYSFSEKLSLEKENNGKYNFVLQFEEYNMEEVNNILDVLKKKEIDSIDIAIEDIPYLRATIDEESAKGKFVFSNVIYPEVSEITEENVWMAQLLDEVWNGEELPYAFEVEEFIYDTDKNGGKGREEHFGCSVSSELDSIEEKLCNVYEDAEVYINQDFSISILLNLPVDETLPEESLRIVEEMYKESNFEESICTNLSFYFIVEDDINNERGRIFFRKNYESFRKVDGSVYMNGIFRGGRLERYKDTFKSLIDSSEFVKKYTHKDLTFWTYD